MSDSQRLLERIESHVVEHGGDLSGWTRLVDGSLQLFDGRVTLTAEIGDAGRAGESGAVHAHVFTRLHDYDDEVLDACIFGMGDDRDGSLAQAAVIWVTGVAGPIKSFLDDKPVCMTCRAGVKGGDKSRGEVEGDYGLPGLRAFVGPGISRAFGDDGIESKLDDSRPWFRFAAESAAPRRVHLAKASVVSKGDAGWYRELEIDGHDVSHHEPDWPAGVRGPDFGYITRFAVFEFDPDSPELARRAEVERTIVHFAENYARAESVERLMEDMVARGFDPDLVHEAESLSTIAFGRSFFEPHGVRYSATIIRARRDGRVEADVPLMSLPAYSRARALAPRLAERMSERDVQALCLYNAESHAIVQAMEASKGELDLTKMSMYPCVVPDRGVDRRTMDSAMKTLRAMVDPGRAGRKKPWWKFW